MEIIGTIKKIGEIQSFASGFTKRDAVVLTNEQYPQPINVEFLQDKSSLLENFNEGDLVKVSINLRGREWQAPDGTVKYFNSIVGWRIEKDTNSASEEPTSVPNASSSPVSNSNPFDDDKDDDLPF